MATSEDIFMLVLKDLPLTDEKIFRTVFLRRQSYVIRVSSAFLIGGGVGLAINP